MRGDGELDLVGRRVLVTGASGFIGARLVDRLVDRGAEIIAVSRQERLVTEGSISWRKADLADPVATRQLLKSTQPEFVFHLASWVAGARDPGLVVPTMLGNLCSTVHVLSAAIEVNSTRVVLAGSIEEPEPGEDRSAPSSPYAVAKWASTGYARMFHELWDLPVTVLRIAMVYGPGQLDVTKLLPYVILSLLQGRPPQLSSGSRGIDWIYVDDVVEAFLAASSAPDAPGRVIQIGSGTSVTIRDTVEMISSLVSSSARPNFGALADRKLDRARIADLESATDVLGWHPSVDLEDGLRSTISWYAGQLEQGRLRTAD